MEATARSSGAPTFSKLPAELVSYILNELLRGIDSRFVCQFVCKEWNAAVCATCAKFRTKDAKGHEVAAAAALQGHLGVLKWLRSEGYMINREVSQRAAEGGHWGVLVWLRDTAGVPFWHQVWVAAAEGGHVDLVKELVKEENAVETNPDWKCLLARSAARGGHIEMVKWVLENGYDVDSYARVAVAQRGDLDIVKLLWAHERNGYGWSEYIGGGASAGGHLHVLQWLRDNGVPWALPSVFEKAAEGGHIEVIQWAKENGCPWTDTFCSYASGNGHFHVLRWARENGAPWSPAGVCSDAARLQNWDMLKWAAGQRCPCDRNTTMWIAKAGRVDILQWSKTLGWEMNEDVCRVAAEHGHLDVLQWARINGVPWDAETCASAAGAGHFEVLKVCRYV